MRECKCHFATLSPRVHKSSDAQSSETVRKLTYSLSDLNESKRTVRTSLLSCPAHYRCTSIETNLNSNSCCCCCNGWLCAHTHTHSNAAMFYSKPSFSDSTAAANSRSRVAPSSTFYCIKRPLGYFETAQHAVHIWHGLAKAAAAVLMEVTRVTIWHRATRPSLRRRLSAKLRYCTFTGVRPTDRCGTVLFTRVVPRLFSSDHLSALTPYER